MPRILIVSGDARFVSTCDTLGGRRFTVETATDFKTAFSGLLNSPFDALIINLAKGTEGIDFIKRVRNNPKLSSIPILVTTKWGTGYATLALSAGADAYEPAAYDAEALMAALKRLLTRAHAVAK